MKTMLKRVGRALPERLRRMIVNYAFEIERPHYDLMAHKYCFAPHMRHGLLDLRRRGFAPRGIVDIGAFEGNWSLMAHEIWPDAGLVLIEANQQKHPRLERIAEDKGFRLERALLGPQDGLEVTFHVMESGSSVYEENSPLEREAVTLRTRRLDDVVQAADTPDLIKMDVQGYELEVLRGGLETLARAQAVLIELSLIEINQGAPILHEALDFMAGHGFVTFDIFEFHRRPLDGALNQIDVLFVRADAALRADKRHYAE